MTNLSRHIEALLVMHDCVVVPRLGGFVAHTEPAHYDMKERCYTPPSRNVTFNARLAINDGLLIERYIIQNGLCYTDAVRLLDTHVEMLKNNIRENGEVELIGVGRLASNGENGYSFTPREHGLISPDFYGLKNTYVNPYTAEDSAPMEEESDIEEEPTSYSIRISRRVVNYAAAVAIGIMFCFLLPFSNGTSCTTNIASVIPITTTTKAPAPTAVPQKATKPAPKVTEQKEVAPKPEKEFVIVLASDLGRHNAEAYVEQLTAWGILSARITETSTMRRVVMGHFPTQEDAEAYCRDIRQNERFATCWVMPL